MASRKRKHVTLKDKVQNFKLSNNIMMKSVQDLKVEYGCGQTQIYLIKQKEAITNTYKTNISTQVHLSLGH